ncbi:hypothetical protein V5H41_29605, partial [Salmonella enterica]
KLAPHFAMEVHLHLSAAYPLEPCWNISSWLNPLFNEQAGAALCDGSTPAPFRSVSPGAVLEHFELAEPI